MKGYKIRIYPTKKQEQLMWKHVNACRYIWNYMLAYQNENYKNGEKYISAFGMMKLLTPLKNDGEHDWLYEVSNHSLQTECKDLNEAFQAFFKKLSGYPKFKSRKRSKPNYPLRSDSIWFDKNSVVHIAKLGTVKYKSDFTFSIGKGITFCNPRISYKNGKWMLSFALECENQASELNDYSMGIDLGVKETATVAYGDKTIVYHNINKSKKMRDLEQRIKHLQRSISRKYEANKQGNKFIKTKNIEREEDKLRKLYARQSNIRNNYIHQMTSDLIELKPSRIVMEDLNVKGMLKNKHLSKLIGEQCFYEIIRQMEYKCEWNGIEFIQVDRFYPSSKTCCKCGNIKHDLKLKDRTFICPVCGNKIDRDLNAAINLMRYKV